VGPRNHVVDKGVKFGRFHLQPREMTRWRCSLLPDYFGHLCLFLRRCPLCVKCLPLQCPPVAIAIAKMKQGGEFAEVTNNIKFNVVELSDLMGWDSSPVKKELKLLEWTAGRSVVFAGNEK